MPNFNPNVPVYDQHQFAQQDGVLMAFASTLAKGEYVGRLFGGRGDVGFGIRSKLTGKTIYFVHDEARSHKGAAVFTAVVEPTSAIAFLRAVVQND